MDGIKLKKCQECNGTGKLTYSNTGITNDCMYCNGFGKVPAPSNAPQSGKEKK